MGFAPVKYATPFTGQAFHGVKVIMRIAWWQHSIEQFRSIKVIALSNANPCHKFSESMFDGLVKSRKAPVFFIPAPHLVRDKLQTESTPFKWLNRLWTPVFTGVTDF
jgi:hypothetical protein